VAGLTSSGRRERPHEEHELHRVQKVENEQERVPAGRLDADDRHQARERGVEDRLDEEPAMGEQKGLGGEPADAGEGEQLVIVPLEGERQGRRELRGHEKTDRDRHRES
jgi:hypothetical protein